MMPLPPVAPVSVVVPSYNSGETIGEALLSVEGQTLRPLETIVVDDGSSDVTVEEVVKFRTGNDGSTEPASTNGARVPVRLLEQKENLGPAAARNRGVSEADGEWIAFLDADDAWLPGRLATQFELSAQHSDVGMWCGEAVRVTADGRRIAGGEGEGEENSESVEWREIHLREFASCNPVATSTVLVRREVVESVGGFDVGFRGPEDYDLWIRVAARCRVGLIQAPMARYRLVPGSLSMDDRTFLPEVLRVLDKAFSADGALAEHADMRSTAYSLQYWYASWMAFHRGIRSTALRLCITALFYNFSATERPPRAWCRLIWRYLFGKAEAACEEGSGVNAI